MEDLHTRLQATLGGRYRVREQIGIGGTAVVFAADDLKLRRPVALKVLRPDRTVDVIADRFLEEIRLVAPLSHPNILPLYESGEVDNLLYYVMPYVAGGTLRSLIEQSGPLRTGHVVSILSDVARGLDYAHSRNVIHRDIKPENILLEDDRARLADFGVALALRRAGPRLSGEGLLVGTPHYMSPEQCAGISPLTPATDIYSLGCVVYEMLTGEPPFSGSSARSVCGRHMTSLPTDLRTLRPTLTNRTNRVVLAALAKVPADRPKTAAVLSEQLSTALRVPAIPGLRLGPNVRSSVLLAVGVLVAIVFGVLVRAILRSPTAGTPRYALTETGVRPFTVDGTPPEFAWLGSALASELTHGLAEVPALSVVRPTAFRSYPVDRFTLDSITQLLRIGTIVDGRITVVDDSLFIVVSLSETATHRQLGAPVRVAVSRGEEWRLAQRLVYDIVSQLRRVLGREIEQSAWRQAAPNSDAWEAVWRADALREEARRLGRDTTTMRAAHGSLDDAEALLVRAESVASGWLTPTILLGWIDADRVALSENDPRGDVDTSQVRAWITRGLGHANDVLSRQGDDAEALELRGLLYVRQWHWMSSPPSDLLARAQGDLERAVQIAPGMAVAWLTLGTVYRRQGDFDAAARATTRARQADAWLEEVAASVAREQFDAMRQGDLTSATTSCAFGRQHHPTDPLFVKCELDIVGWFGEDAGDIGRAWDLLEAIEAHPAASALTDQAAYRRSLVAAVAARAGQHDSAHAIMRRAQPLSVTTGGARNWPFQQAWVELLLGDTTSSLASLERYLAAEPARRDFVREHPWFAALRQDPTFVRATSPPAPDSATSR